MSENWLPVVGYEGLYEVSDHGNVRSLDRAFEYMRRSGPVVGNRKGKVLSPRPHCSGHLSVGLCRDGQESSQRIHRLVLEAFRGPCPPGHECCHWDDDPSNNRLDNLRWGTRSENTLDKVRNGKHHNAQKTHCPVGHEYTDENTYTSGDRRSCKTCIRDRSARRRAA